ncbi:MAG: hypothetical protein ABH873_05190 [Candidatus Firestonebacteria bacterium]
MIKGGKGGATTNKHGLAFESRVDLRVIFNKLNNYEVKDNDLYFKNNLIGKFYKKYGLYSGLLEEEKINWKNILSKKLLPDETILILKDKTLYIIEMKFQHGAGSVDEKLQTCDFKLKQYKKLFKGTNIKVKYIYILNDWYKKPEYEDTMKYIKSVGCNYYFKKLPLSVLGLPDY